MSADERLALRQAQSQPILAQLHDRLVTWQAPLLPRHPIDPQRYLTQLLTNLPATPMSQLCQWLPDQWKLRNPASPG